VKTFFLVYFTLRLEPKLFLAAFGTTVLLPKLVGAAPHVVSMLFAPCHDASTRAVRQLLRARIKQS
jgi:hypothetical protein